jgi:hypothetical protein
LDRPWWLDVFFDDVIAVFLYFLRDCEDGPHLRVLGDLAVRSRFVTIALNRHSDAAK